MLGMARRLSSLSVRLFNILAGQTKSFTIQPNQTQHKKMMPWSNKPNSTSSLSITYGVCVSLIKHRFLGAQRNHGDAHSDQSSRIIKLFYLTSWELASVCFILNFPYNLRTLWSEKVKPCLLRDAGKFDIANYHNCVIFCLWLSKIHKWNTTNIALQLPWERGVAPTCYVMCRCRWV